MYSWNSNVTLCFTLHCLVIAIGFIVQGDDFEVNLTDSGGSAHEHSPDISVPPAFVTEHQPKIEEVSNKRRRKRRSQDETAQSATDVQDLTGDKISLHVE